MESGGVVTYRDQYGQFSGNSLAAEGLLRELPTVETILGGTLHDWDSGSGLISRANSLLLLRDGCTTGSNDEPNCTTVCADTTKLFSKWEATWDCLTLASLKLAKLDPALPADTEAKLNTVVGYLGIDNLTNFDAIGVLDKVYDCAAASCLKNNCSVPYPSVSKSQPTLEVSKWYTALQAVCDNVDQEYSINPDLAGPGVIVSYMMQSGFLLFIWLCVRIVTVDKVKSWLRATFRSPKSRTKTKSAAKSDRSGLVARIEHSTTTFLAEMQEAQCFFIIATQIAVTFADSQSANFYGASSWQVLVLNRALVQLLSSLGPLPITLAQILLYQLEIDSAYSLGLCTIAVTMAYVMCLDNLSLSPITVYDMFATVDNLEQCGGHPSLRTFCVESIDSRMVPNVGEYMVVIPCTIVVLLWHIKVWRNVAAENWFKSRMEMISPTTKKWLSTINLYSGYLITFFLVGGELLLVASLGLSLLRLDNLLGNVLETAPNTSWTLGQVIAMLIWAPVVAKYLYLLIFGVKKGFGIRVSKAYAIVKRVKSFGSCAPVVVNTDEDAESDNGEDVKNPLISVNQDYDDTPVLKRRGTM